MRLHIRDATPADLPAILALTAEDSMHYYADEPTEPTPELLAALDEITRDAHQRLLVGELDGVVVVTAQVTYMRMLNGNGALYCQVESVRTASRLRGQGLGGELMQYIEDEARLRGVARIQLTSNAQRKDAHRFYERLGYTASHVGMKKYL